VKTQTGLNSLEKVSLQCSTNRAEIVWRMTDRESISSNYHHFSVQFLRLLLTPSYNDLPCQPRMPLLGSPSASLLLLCRAMQNNLFMMQPFPLVWGGGQFLR
jgi:hypothetical protein